MKKEVSYLVIIVLTFVLSLGLIKFYQQESFETNVKNKVFNECFEYYSSQGVGSDTSLINVCFSKANYVLEKK